MYDRTMTRLAAIARARIRNGELPCTDDPTVWAGSGVAKACSLCDRVISPQEIGYEVELPRKAEVAQHVLRFHITCHTAWVVVCSEQPLASIS